jgi:hypothetical protein
MIKPKGGFAPDVETAQRFLGRTYVARGEKPFSLTLDQLHQGQKTLIDTMGSISRSSFGGGRVMRRSDLRNAEAVTQWVDNFLSSATKTDPRTFGNMMKGMMNKDLHFVETEKNALYDAFRETAFGKGIEVNFGDAFDVLRSNSDSRFARSALAKIVSSNPRIRAAIDAGDALLMRTPDEIQAIFEGWPTEKIDEVLDAMTNNLPLEHAVDLYHNLNRMIKKGSEKGMRRSVNQFKGELDNALKESLGETAYGQFQKANEFTARHGERIHQSIMETIFKKIGDKKPSGIIGLFSGGQAADTMTVVKDFFRSSDALNMQDFEETVRQPLRHWFLSRAIDKETGIVSGAKLARTLDNLERRAGPGFLKEVFGPNAPQALREAATTLNLLSKSSEANIFVKIVQAGALSGATMGLMYGTGQPIERIVGGGAAVLVAPWASHRRLHRRSWHQQIRPLNPYDRQHQPRISV